MQHSLSRGPGRVIVRFHQDVTLSEVMACRPDVVKNAAVNVPYGGAKGGIRVNARAVEGVSWAPDAPHASEIRFAHRPHRDIPAPDVNTNG